jgi:hypothetical protein
VIAARVPQPTPPAPQRLAVALVIRVRARSDVDSPEARWRGPLSSIAAVGIASLAAIGRTGVGE